MFSIPKRDEPFDAVWDREQVSAVRDTIDDLPKREAFALLLRYWEGWTYSKIGREFGITCYRARQMAKKAEKRFKRKYPFPREEE